MYSKEIKKIDIYIESHLKRFIFLKKEINKKDKYKTEIKNKSNYINLFNKKFKNLKKSIWKFPDNEKINFEQLKYIKNKIKKSEEKILEEEKIIKNNNEISQNKINKITKNINKINFYLELPQEENLILNSSLISFNFEETSKFENIKLFKFLIKIYYNPLKSVNNFLLKLNNSNIKNSNIIHNLKLLGLDNKDINVWSDIINKNYDSNNDNYKFQKYLLNIFDGILSYTLDDLVDFEIKKYYLELINKYKFCNSISLKDFADKLSNNLDDIKIRNLLTGLTSYYNKDNIIYFKY